MDVFGQERQYAPEELSRKADQYETKTLLKEHGYIDEPLGFEDAYLLGCQTLYGLGNNELEDVFDQNREEARYQSLTALSVLHDQELYSHDGAAEQIAGVTAAIFEYDIGEDSTIAPDAGNAMDNCGMGGDMYRTPNVSTLAALTVAADGIKMCKHGSPGNTDSTGSSDFLEHLGFDLMTDQELTEAGVEQTGFGYSEALNTDYKDIHRQTHEHADLPHMNDIIGPITNPLHPATHSRRVVGVNHLMDPQTVAEAYRELNERGITATDHLIAVRGFVEPGADSGIDEASVMEGGSTVAELQDGEITTYDLEAGDFGLEPVDYEEIDPGAYEMTKPELGEAILRGEVENGARDLIAANAALLYYLDDGTPLDEGTERAIEVLESGRPYENAKQASAVSQREKQ